MEPTQPVRASRGLVVSTVMLWVHSLSVLAIAYTSFFFLIGDIAVACSLAVSGVALWVY